VLRRQSRPDPVCHVGKDQSHLQPVAEVGGRLEGGTRVGAEGEMRRRLHGVSHRPLAASEDADQGPNGPTRRSAHARCICR
jgi:hypothetical protein